MQSVASRRSRTSRREEKNIHEGWVQRYSFTGTWSLMYMTLQDNSLQLYYVDRVGRKIPAKLIHLGENATIEDRPNIGNYCASFELITDAANAGKQHNLFQFRNENDRDLWKGYITASSKGVVPRDVKLLPGQLVNVQQTIRRTHQARPRPTLDDLHERPDDSPYARIDELLVCSDGDTGMTSEMTSQNGSAAETVGDSSANQLSDNLPDVSVASNDVGGHPMTSPETGELEDDVIDQMTSRTSPLNTKSKSVFSTTSTHPHPSARHRAALSDVFIRNNQQVPTMRRPAADIPPPPESYCDVSSQHIHLFYAEPERNRFAPSWFVECTRT